MLRLVHNQTVAGGLLINDIDDGLPNKTARRGLGDPKTYQRDGYANKPKQPCYLPRNDLATPSLAGHIDLLETDRVLLSYQKGTIAGLSQGSLLSVTSFNPSDIAVPVLTSVATSAGVMTLTGTAFTSVAPYLSTVVVGEESGLTIGTGSAGVSYEAQAVGVGGQAITVAHVKAGISTALSVGVVSNAITVNLATSAGTKAAVTLTGVDGNGGVVYTAVTAGVAGNSITVAQVVSGLTTALSVAVVGTAITVHAQTDGGGLVLSTATAVAAAIAASGPAAALVLATVTGTGASLISPAGATPLASGVDPVATSTAAQVVAAVNAAAPAFALVNAAIVSGAGAGTAIAAVAAALTGGASVTLTSAAIVTATGTFTQTSIVIPASLITGARTGWTAKVNANNQASATVVST